MNVRVVTSVTFFKVIRPLRLSGRVEKMFKEIDWSAPWRWKVKRLRASLSSKLTWKWKNLPAWQKEKREEKTRQIATSKLCWMKENSWKFLQLCKSKNRNSITLNIKIEIATSNLNLKKSWICNKYFYVCCVEIDRRLEAYYITLHNDRDPVRNCPKMSVTVPDFANFFVMERPKSTSSDP